MGRKSQEKMTGKTYEQRKASAGNPFSRAIRALKRVNRDRVSGKKHQYGVANASRDGIPKNLGVKSISLREEPKPSEPTQGKSEEPKNG